MMIACAQHGGCVDPATTVIRVNLGGVEIMVPACDAHTEGHVVIELPGG